MSATARLAERAADAADAEPPEYLRGLTLTNLAAGAGRKGSGERLIGSMPLDAERSASDAAFLLAAMLHARTQDDFYPEGRVHVGAVTLAATLALADQAGDRLLNCLGAGYEVMCAVSEAYAPAAQEAGLRPSGVFGPLGAAASAAVALGLERSQIATALGLAAASSAGTNQAWLSGTDEWLLEVGAAARAGVEAALLARAGAVGSPVALEGPAGWARAFFGDPDASKLRPVLGEPRSRISDVAVKLYPVSGIAQVPTVLACRARDELGGAVPDRVVLRVSAAEAGYPGSQNPGPFQSRSSALMSLRFCVACGLADGLVSIERLEDANTPDLAVIGSRVDIETGVPENRAELHATAGSASAALSGEVRRHLHPSWGELRSTLPGLADRSQAPLAAVEAACVCLSERSPKASRARALLLSPPGVIFT